MDEVVYAAVRATILGGVAPEPPATAKPLATEFRAAPPHAQVRPQLGPLADLPGTWVGRGFTLTALPLKVKGPGQKIFRLKLNATTDFITFSLIGAPIPDRGSLQDDIFFVGVHYFQQVVNAVDNTGLHLETGMWLNLPATTAPPQSPSVARMATIPHGDALLAQGPFVSFKGKPTIQALDSRPFTLDPSTGKVLRNFPLGYMDPYSHSDLPPGISQQMVVNPNLLLAEAIRNQNIVSTVAMVVNARPVGGINNQPIVPPNVMNDVGGIVNIPFVKANADANAFSSTFWVETVANPDGTEFLQLQYTQTTILDFDGVKWPHISVGTLIQQ